MWYYCHWKFYKSDDSHLTTNKLFGSNWSLESHISLYNGQWNQVICIICANLLTRKNLYILHTTLAKVTTNIYTYNFQMCSQICSQTRVKSYASMILCKTSSQKSIPITQSWQLLLNFIKINKWIRIIYTHIKSKAFSLAKTKKSSHLSE